MTSSLRGTLAVLAVLFVSGCANTVAYNPSYVAAARRPAVVADGKVQVVTAPADDAFVFTGSPTSFTGGGTKLTLPMGSIVRESAVAAFADIFKGGAEAAATPATGTLVVAPKLLAFSYEYNQLKNIGFAITPTAVVKLEVRVLDATGNAKWRREYDSGPVEGGSYMVNFAAHEEINKVAHKAAYDTLRRAAVDIARELAGAKVPDAAAQ